jgi:hypothetical protein
MFNIFVILAGMVSRVLSKIAATALGIPKVQMSENMFTNCYLYVVIP